METILERASAIEPDLVALRRALHQVPELDRHLPKTQRLVLDSLAGLDLEGVPGRELSSGTAVLRGGGPPGLGAGGPPPRGQGAPPRVARNRVPFPSQHAGRLA